MTTQLTFDSLAAREIRMARRHDPETSKDAASQAHQLAHDHGARILAVLELGGEFTAHEIAARCGLSPEQVNRRIRQLSDDDAIAHYGQRATPSGRQARCWRMP